MESLKELFQEADWKAEKHVPVIEAPAKTKKQDAVKVTLTVGKEIPHPNTTEHHIRWIAVFFHPKGEKFPYQIGRFEFCAHGESVQAPNASTIYSQPAVTCSFKTEKSGTILASSYCNIHGLWENAQELAVE
ncbi:MAG: class II SORL domain-containing protein [Candidatus Omnitrophica bacterium]|nr:class II SORL domain-containing protein [Candidatus Omnitrophota bacterium]